MAQVQIIYWGDFPAQVQAKEGGITVSLPLPERFQQAIDAAAMHAGATDPDAYLDGWRHGGWADHPGAAQEAAEAVRNHIIGEYTARRLAELVHAASEQGHSD